MKALAMWKIFSAVFQPILISTYCALLLVSSDFFSETMNPLLFVLAIFTFTALVPFLGIVILKQRGAISSILLPERTERTKPYIITIVCYAAAIAFLYYAHTPPLVVNMMLGSVIAVLCCGVVNFRWKISAHLCGMGSLTAMIALFAWRNEHFVLLPLVAMVLLSLCVAISRIVLKAHTAMQTVAGFAMGFSGVCLFSLLV
ncbi:MAG: phosphatase PAP2 family protein [Bacteroidales bacterium]|jgi:membrane-associated phospholipid phosphatase|nr:phosphatase PAP2 family protein [Bacteroidales bacterium]